MIKIITAFTIGIIQVFLFGIVSGAFLPNLEIIKYTKKSFNIKGD